VVSLSGVAWHPLSDTQRAVVSIPARSDRHIEVAIDEERDPAQSGERVSYRVTVGNRGPEVAEDVELRVAVPDGASGLASFYAPGSTVVGNEVIWALGAVPPGTSVIRRVAIVVDPGRPQGALLRTLGVRAIDLSAPGQVAHAQAITRLAGASLLDLELIPRRRSVDPGEELPVLLRVRNRGLDPRFGVRIETRVPEELSSFNQATTVGGGDCTGSGTGNTNCDPRERVLFNLGTMAPGQTRIVSLTSTVRSGTEPGELISLSAIARDDDFNRAIDTDTVPIPEPKATALMLWALAAMGALDARWRFRQRQRAESLAQGEREV
jgi:hypothetical protein